MLPPFIASYIAAKTVTHNKQNNTNPIAAQIRYALAQFARLGFSPELNAQTNNIMMPTNGIKEINRVMTQSLVDITGACSLSILILGLGGEKVSDEFIDIKMLRLGWRSGLLLLHNQCFGDDIVQTLFLIREACHNKTYK